VRTVSLLTTVEPSAAKWLPAVAASAHATISWHASRGVTVEWVLIVDGPGPLPKFRTGENVTMRRTANRSGPAACKNLAAVGAHGDWLVSLAPDTELYAGGLHELLNHRGMTDVAWACAGSRGGGPLDSATVGSPISYPVGALAQAWSGPLPFNPSNLLVRRDALLAVGGWPAVAEVEDLALVVALNASYPGAAVPHTVFGPREWEGRRHHAPGWADTVTDSRWAISNLVRGAGQ
jgi:hypothetical protein